MFELKSSYQLYILNIIRNNNFTYFEIPIGCGKSNIIMNYSEILSNKKFGILSPSIIFNNYLRCGKLNNVNHINLFNFFKIDINNYDVIIVESVLLKKTHLLKLINFVNSGKKIILLDVSFYDKINTIEYLKNFNMSINIFSIDKLKYIDMMYNRTIKIKKLKDKLIVNK